MAMIQKISASSRNGETNALFTLILTTFAKSDWTADLYLKPVLISTQVNSTTLNLAIRRLKAYSQMAKKDEVRDTQIRDLFKLVEGYTHIPIAEIKEAALLLYSIMVQYGLAIINEDYAEESSDIDSLLTDLSQADILIAIAKLQGVSETIAALNVAQKDFENLAVQQAEGDSVKNDLVSASKLKKEMIAEFNGNLRGYMNTMAMVKPEMYEATTKTIAKLVDNNNELVKRRRKTNEPDTELV
ncbi:DUF6261 family protein [Ancylomarina sp.]|uniref:DUF6261 family protein n=1 Tax=Ancylomarina sp. TaxID=1970196 RepID=UPI003568B3C2